MIRKDNILKEGIVNAFCSLEIRAEKYFTNHHMQCPYFPHNNRDYDLLKESCQVHRHRKRPQATDRI